MTGLPANLLSFLSGCLQCLHTFVRRSESEDAHKDVRNEADLRQARVNVQWPVGKAS